MASDSPSSPTLTPAQAFKVMELYLASHMDVIEPSEDIGWFFAHVTAEDDPEHVREWANAVTEVLADDAH